MSGCAASCTRSVLGFFFDIDVCWRTSTFGLFSLRIPLPTQQ
jgi:hypothetical protein